MLGVGNEPCRPFSNVPFPVRDGSWNGLGAQPCRILRRFPAFLRPLIKHRWRRCARSFRKIWWRGLRSLLFFRSSSVQCAFTLHKQLLISSFHGTLPFFPFMKMSLSLLLSACFHLVAYLVGPGKSFRMP